MRKSYDIIIWSDGLPNRCITAVDLKNLTECTVGIYTNFLHTRAVPTVLTIDTQLVWLLHFTVIV